MKRPLPVLDYRQRNSNGGRLTLDHADGDVRVIFPVPRTWVYILPIAGGAALGLMKFAMGIWMALAMRRVLLQTHGPPSPETMAFLHRFEVGIFVDAGLSGSFWWGIAAFNWWKLRRWGRVPRILSASAGGLVWSRLGWLRMRERRWPCSEIAGIEIRPVKGNLAWWLTVADLNIRRRSGRRLRFRLFSRDQQLPEQIAAQLAHALECPLCCTASVSRAIEY
jgi:hypothetical protein